MCENLADFPVAVVKYWNYMIDGCKPIKEGVLAIKESADRDEYQGRGSGHEHGLHFLPNRPPDSFLDTFLEAARAVVLKGQRGLGGLQGHVMEGAVEEVNNIVLAALQLGKAVGLPRSTIDPAELPGTCWFSARQAGEGRIRGLPPFQ